MPCSAQEQPRKNLDALDVELLALEAAFIRFVVGEYVVVKIEYRLMLADLRDHARDIAVADDDVGRAVARDEVEVARVENLHDDVDATA